MKTKSSMMMFMRRINSARRIFSIRHTRARQHANQFSREAMRQGFLENARMIRFVQFNDRILAARIKAKSRATDDAFAKLLADFGRSRSSNCTGGSDK